MAALIAKSLVTDHDIDHVLVLVPWKSIQGDIDKGMLGTFGEMGLDASEVLVVGDDPETDGEGARLAGCRVAMVRTGKFETSRLDLASLQPDLVLASVAEIL